MNVLGWVLSGMIVAAASYAALLAFGAWRWRLATGALVARLDAADIAVGTESYDPREIADLPAPVRQYFEIALTPGQPIIRAVDLALAGTFNLGLEVPNWKPFTSTQRVVTRRPGFVWSGRIALFPGIPGRVHDAYVAGEGVLRPTLLGLIGLGGVQGKGEIARGELMRWLAETVWYPTALLPSQGVQWQAVDANSALATLTEGTITLTMLFRFGEDGLVSGIRVEARGALVKGQTMMMPWEGRFHDYRRQDGMMLPFHGEVAWITSQGERPYFRGTVTGIEYRFARSVMRVSGQSS